MAAYYNENDPKTAAWLRELITARLIADGEVDTRSIVDVRPADLAGFIQCHFFAGIGGWSYALRLAGWPDDRECWTGSCPCQPWSLAGYGAEANDPRHLWPSWFGLISERGPSVVFGEQVAKAPGLAWLDVVCDDLEGIEYAVGPCVLPGASVGAPHNRERLWFVAHANREGLARPGAAVSALSSGPARTQWGVIAAAISNDSLGATLAGSPCARQPMLFTGDDGLSAAVGRLRGYGNAIVPQVAAEFIGAYLDVEAAI